MRNINRLSAEKFSFGIKDIIKDAIIALILCLMLYVFSSNAFVFVLFIPFSIAAIIGDLVRKYTRPNAISTRGSAWKVLNNKIYWYIGPQIEAIILSIFLFYILAQAIGHSYSSENQNATENQNAVSEISETINYRD